MEDDHTYFVGTIGGVAWVHNTSVPHLVSLNRAMRDVETMDVRVGTREEAERIAIGYGAGYKNMTGESGEEAELLTRLSGNEGYYHWADNAGPYKNTGNVCVEGHEPSNVHSLYRHVQFHDLTPGGSVRRVFYGGPVR